jgi:hypothetical protein
MLALKSFRTAAITLAGLELAHRIRKRQFTFGVAAPRRFTSLKQLCAYALNGHQTDKDALDFRYRTRTQVAPC